MLFGRASCTYRPATETEIENATSLVISQRGTCESGGAESTRVAGESAWMERALDDSERGLYDLSLGCPQAPPLASKLVQSVDFGHADAIFVVEK